MTYTIHWDWIQLYCHHSKPLQNGIYNEYLLKLQGYQTRQFRKVFEVFKNEINVATITCEPNSGFLNDKAVFIKFDNALLYSADLYKEIYNILTSLQLEFKNITRLDIAMDFDKFNNNNDGNKFISLFLKNYYVKNKPSKFKVIGMHKQVNMYEYINFGSGTSNITYKLYNKYRELHDVKMKPYILDTNEIAGINIHNEFWRLEYTINNSDTCITNELGKFIYNAKDINTINPDNKEQLFKYLCTHYFDFKLNNGKKRKDRMEQINLFNWVSKQPTFYRPEPSNTSGRSDKIWANKLNQLNQELRGNDFDSYIFSRNLLTQFIYNRGLEEWAEKKQIDFAKQFKITYPTPKPLTRKISPIFFSKVNV